MQEHNPSCPCRKLGGGGRVEGSDLQARITMVKRRMFFDGEMMQPVFSCLRPIAQYLGALVQPNRGLGILEHPLAG